MPLGTKEFGVLSVLPSTTPRRLQAVVHSRCIFIRVDFSNTPQLPAPHGVTDANPEHRSGLSGCWKGNGKLSQNINGRVHPHVLRYGKFTVEKLDRCSLYIRSENG